MLLSIAKLQNLKAIHNFNPHWRIYLMVVINRKTTKFESNSQHLDLTLANGDVVINRKTTKFESNSQHTNLVREALAGCYQSQNYKI